MAGSDQEGADQSTLDQGTSSTSDGQQLGSAREDAAGDSSQNQESTEESPQRSIRDMLDDEGEASVFVNRDLVEPDTIIDEERIVGRDDQLESVVSFLKPTLQGNRPPNMLLYGPAGTGKSLIIGAVTQQIIELCQSKGERFGVVDINCQPINTLDQAVYELVQTVAQDVGTEVGVPETGVSTKRKYRRLYELINEHYDSVIFILDEIDLLVGRRENDEPAYSKLLYQLSRASNTNEIEGRVSVAALTNDPKFMEDIDGRAESSFNPRDVYFPDYDANQLREILENRRDAFRQDALEDDVIPLVAAFAAQSHGDARKAIDLFRGAGDLADERADEEVTEDHVRESQEEIDKDRSLKLVEGLTTQKKISLYATAAVAYHSSRTGSSVPSPVGFKVYQWVTNELDADQMTRETYVKYVKELSTYGLISTSRKSRGRGGGMYMEFTFTGDPEAMMTRIVDDTRLEGIAQQEELLSSVVNAQLKEFHEE
ncbi:cell division control protein Cdc6 [Haloglomus irregulare]|uniref:ORC1-type DNA replication protein n=1 Tax=Haloglomus irregulare TaxID=2234134 RepID=A0A554MUU3_9EURY|nr:orc1/cdc6 family replication initiation protein [Haloglomus irregulare]TSD08894.1 cell division control protein Cdc6 [Haloglomus irregulare]